MHILPKWWHLFPQKIKVTLYFFSITASESHLLPVNTSPMAQHSTATPRSSYVTTTAHFTPFPWDAARMHGLYGTAWEKCSNEARSCKRLWQQYLSTLTVFTTKSCKYKSALFCMLIVQTNGWWKEKRAGIAVIQKGATAEVSAEENPAAAPRTPKNTSARQQGFMCSPSQSSAPIPHHPYIPQKKKKTGTRCSNIYPELFVLHLPLNSLQILRTNLKWKDTNFRGPFFFFPPPWGFTVLLCLLNWQELLSSQFAQTQLLQRFRQNTCRAFINQLSQERLFFK